MKSMTDKFSERLRDARRACKLSQIQLSEMMEVNERQCSRWEIGAVMPRADQIDRLCDILHVSADWLLGRVDECLRKD